MLLFVFIYFFIVVVVIFKVETCLDERVFSPGARSVAHAGTKKAAECVQRRQVSVLKAAGEAGELLSPRGSGVGD